MANAGVATIQPMASHLGDNDDCAPMDGLVACDSGQGQAQGIGSCVFGAPADDVLVAVKDQPTAAPKFCGGAGNMDASMEPAPAEPDEHLAEEPEIETQSPLDHVVQNLHCRTGNFCNRCFANAPFRLWAWAGSFINGRTTALEPRWCCCHGGAQGRGCGQHHLSSTLWQQFDDTVQDDASHFLMALAHLADSQQLIKGYYHADHRRQVHKRQAFPTHLLRRS